MQQIYFKFKAQFVTFKISMLEKIVQQNLASTVGSAAQTTYYTSIVKHNAMLAAVPFLSSILEMGLTLHRHWTAHPRSIFTILSLVEVRQMYGKPSVREREKKNGKYRTCLAAKKRAVVLFTSRCALGCYQLTRDCYEERIC